MTRSPRMEALYDVFLRKKPRQSRSRSVVEAILGATGERLENADGVDNVTVQQVAERAGVGIGSLYDYFRDRDGLLAGFAAKVTEDNLRDFEELLAATHDLSLRESVERIVDHALATYVENPKLPRTITRIAFTLGFVPTVVESQTSFALAMARTLAERKDLHPALDHRAAAYVLTHSIMGVVLTLIWQAEETVPRAVVRQHLVDMTCMYLSSPPPPSPSPSPSP